MKAFWIAIGSVLALVVLACLAGGVYGMMRYANYRTPSGAMEPTLPLGSVFLTDRFAYRGASPQRGDVVVFMPPIPSADPFIKRVVAVPGDRYAIRSGRAILNGQPVREPYLAERTDYDLAIRDYGISVNGTALGSLAAVVPPRSEWTAPDSVPRGCYVMLGDNRNNSEDSHVYGFVCPGRSGIAGAQVRLIGRAILPPYYKPPPDSSDR
jgi:signal peptidase I